MCINCEFFVTGKFILIFQSVIMLLDDQIYLEKNTKIGYSKRVDDFNL
jgi:hypothetical protein